MKRRRSLLARLDRLDPPSVGGGIIHIEDLESGLVRIEELATRGGGYLLISRPCTNTEEWVQKYGGVQPPAPDTSI